MDKKMKQRILGVALVTLALMIVLPELLKQPPPQPEVDHTVDIPLPPRTPPRFTEPERTLPLEDVALDQGSSSSSSTSTATVVFTDPSVLPPEQDATVLVPGSQPAARYHPGSGVQTTATDPSLHTPQARSGAEAESGAQDGEAGVEIALLEPSSVDEGPAGQADAEPAAQAPETEPTLAGSEPGYGSAPTGDREAPDGRLSEDQTEKSTGRLADDVTGEPIGDDSTSVAGGGGTAPATASWQRPIKLLSLRQRNTQTDSSRQWVVQAGAFALSENANLLRDKLRAKQFPTRLAPAEIDGRTLYLVQIGPYPSRDAGRQAQRRLLQEAKLQGEIRLY